MSDQAQFQDITFELDDVHGGGKARLAWEAVKTGYKATRTAIKEGAEVVKDLGIIGGGMYAVKKGYDYVTGNGGDPRPAQPPAAP